MNDLALENATLLKSSELIVASVGIFRGAINEISSKKIEAKKVVDCEQNFLLPGIIDCHVHFRTPGEERKEDWTTASKACVSSGITTVLDMPNNLPPTTTVIALKEKRKIIQKTSKVNFGLHLGATDKNLNEIKKVARIASIKVFLGKSTGNLIVRRKEFLKKIFEIAKKINIVVCVHAEDQSIIEKNEKKFKNSQDPIIHSKIRDSEAESNAVQLVLELQKKVKNRLHICHVSSKQGIKLIREAKEEQAGVSCEVTPHHLFFTERDLAKLHNFAKVNPSIKSEKDRTELWRGLLDGTIDCIASDHAPHLAEEKKQSYWSAPAGMPGVETLAPLLFNAFSEKKLSLQKIVELCCQNPTKIFGIKNKGFLKKGFDADLALFDLKKSKKVQNSGLFTKCGWSAFSSLKLNGVAAKTFIGGQIVFENGKFNEFFLGQEVF